MADGVRIHRPRRGEALDSLGLNGRLRRLVADQALDIQFLKEVAKSEF